MCLMVVAAGTFAFILVNSSARFLVKVNHERTLT